MREKERKDNPTETRMATYSPYDEPKLDKVTETAVDVPDQSRLHRVRPCVSSIYTASPLATTGAKSPKVLWTSRLLF